MSSITEEDTAYFFLENYIRLINETGSIDFKKLLDSNSEESNYILRDGDVIYIPQKENSIYVFGQVKNPGKVKYIENKDYSYYISQAGGLGEYADDEIMVIKNLSREWIMAQEENSILEEGDYIWVPRTSSHSFNYYVYSIGGYLSIVGSAATIILLLIQLGK
jgi:protein involved in polysaccharide export with SLBB domain